MSSGSLGYKTNKIRNNDSVHLPITHLDGEEDQNETRQPDSTCSKPQNALAPCPQIGLTGEWSDDTSNTTETREHTTGTCSVGRVEQFGRRRIQDGVEVLRASGLKPISFDSRFA